MHSTLSLSRRKMLAVAAGTAGIGVALAGTTIPAQAAVTTAGGGQGPTASSPDTTTVTTTCTTGVMIVLVAPFASIPCAQPVTGGTAPLVTSWTW
jgi:anaerobic selenocysteine-containing dehydrogenase